MTATPVRTVAVVTGGTGRATVRTLAAAGDDVAVLARGEAGPSGAVADLHAKGRRGLGIAIDVAQDDSVVSAADRFEQELGPIRVWVNVAFTSVFARFVDIDPDEYRRVTEVNYLGFVYATKVALSKMLPRDRGTIVQVGSALAYRGIPLQTAYCGSKHAIQGFHEALRCELLHDKSDVHVTMVQMPGVNTPQFDWVPPAAAAGALLAGATGWLVARRYEPIPGDGHTPWHRSTDMANTVSDFIIDRLIERDLHRFYGFPGDGIGGFDGALARAEAAGKDFRHIRPTHEEIASFLACAHANFTGQVGVCIATSGPGAVHPLNGLYDAKMDNQPVVAIVGQQGRVALDSDAQQEMREAGDPRYDTSRLVEDMDCAGYAELLGLRGITVKSPDAAKPPGTRPSPATGRSCWTCTPTRTCRPFRRTSASTKPRVSCPPCCRATRPKRRCCATPSARWPLSCSRRPRTNSPETAEPRSELRDA